MSFLTTPSTFSTAFSILTATSLLCSSSLLAQQGHRKTPLSPEEQQKTFKLADGFVIELVASEENGVINPIDLTFDDAGRLWTQTARMYPLDPVPGINFGQAMNMMRDTSLVTKDERFKKIHRLYKLEDKGTDQILIVEDPTKQAKGPLQVWADGLSIPQSIMPYKNGCYVAHGSELFFLSDKNKDGKQDTMTPVLTNFGFFDTHTMAHSIVRAPGGWMNFSHGAINSGKVKAVKSGQELEITFSKNARFSIDGEKLELVNWHRDNNWGYQILGNGQWYATSANDSGWSVLPTERMMSIQGIGGQKPRSYAPYFPPVHKFRVGGTGISGLAFSDDGAKGFPAEAWKNVAILANPITRKLNCVRIERLADGSVKAEHLKDLLSSSDDWFRPVNIEFGPDGCLYIADWYNRIVSHNEVTTDHPDRDRKHGRIWRVRHVSQKPAKIPNVAKAKTSALPNHLKGESLWEKRAAWHQIVDRQAKSLASPVAKIAADTKQDKNTRIVAIWSLEGLKAYNKAFLAKLIKDKDADVRREAIRSLASYGVSAADAGALLKDAVSDPDAQVRSQVLRTLEEIGTADNSTIALLVEGCVAAAPKSIPGNGYEQNFERFLARKALESYPSELKNYLRTPASAKVDNHKLFWAIQSLPQNDFVDQFLNVWKNVPAESIDKNTLVSLSKVLRHGKIRQAVSKTFEEHSDKLLALTLANSDEIDARSMAVFYDPKIKELLKSSKLADKRQALKLINQLRTPAHNKTLLQFLESGKEIPAKELVETLGNQPGIRTPIFLKVFTNTSLKDADRLAALAVLATRKDFDALPEVKKWVSKLKDAQKKHVVTTLSASRNGNELLKKLWESSVLKNQHWDYTAAIKMFRHKKDETAKSIYNFQKKLDDQDRAERQKLVAKLTKTLATKKGNAKTGKALFGMCTACHQVNGEGQNLAPSLDGSANRALGHLLTAIIDPDAAVEGAYGLYYVTQKNGISVEGYLVKRASQGIIIGQQGGATTFIHRHHILEHGGVGRKSFMPGNFNQLPTKTVADLVAYIKTLK